MYPKERELIEHYNKTLEYFSPVTYATIGQILNLANVDLENKEVHDLGCGTGWFTDWARSIYHADVVGVDYADQRVLKAERHYPLSRYVCDDVYQYVEELPDNKSPNTFFTAWDVLEHLEDPLRLITACRQRGTLIATIPKEMPYHAHICVYKDDNIRTLGMHELAELYLQRDYYVAKWI